MPIINIKRSLDYTKKFFIDFVRVVNEGKVELNARQKEILKELIQIYNNKETYKLEYVKDLHTELSTPELTFCVQWLQYLRVHLTFVDDIVTASEDDPELRAKLYGYADTYNLEEKEQQLDV